jgi:hypothetical protein
MRRAGRMLASATLAVTCSAAPRLCYSKFFKGSTPEYVAIAIERDGRATYQEAKEDDEPIKIQLSATDTEEMFSLAGKLDHFQRPIESGLKVANMGVKTFRFEDGEEKHEIQFNYSQDLSAQVLLDWFERITETEASFISLDRTARYDKLGVNDSLLQLQISWDHQRVVAPDQFLPLLDRIFKNESYLHVARERAAGLAEAIRKPPAQASGKTQP